MDKINVLFVCLGNICRSPLAEGILLQLLEEKGLIDKISVDSAGTANYHIGERPDPRTIENAHKNGVTLPSRGRQFDRSDFENFDYIIPMDESNLFHIRRLEPSTPVTGYTIVKMRKFDPLAENADVPDPYYSGPKGFQDVFDILNRSNTNFLNFLIEKHNF